MNASNVSERNLQRFGRRIELLREALDIPGMSVAIVHKQTVVFARGFGVVNLPNRTEATADTPYPIASVTKTFTAAVIMRLVEAGKLDLDEPLSTYDPGYAQWCAGLKASPCHLGRAPTGATRSASPFATTLRIRPRESRAAPSGITVFYLRGCRR